jgi:glycosyltransferase involved in cell wall biosynthesis
VPRKRILMACPNHWRSVFQVGSHSLARGFADLGWEVAFISDPISPLHLFGGWNAELRARLASFWAGGLWDEGARVWSYVPGALLTPHNKPLLRSGFVHRQWPRLTWPNVVRKVRRRGHGAVDLLYIDSVQQSFWLDAVEYRRSVYRATDYSPHFEKSTPAARTVEREMARRVDLVVYPSPELAGFVESLGAARSLLLPNGVEYEFFARPRPDAPAEYRALSRPIAVYVGVILPWFHFEWVRQAAAALPGFSFVLIGPDELARRELGGLPNVHVLGCRPYRDVPAYLQHADVGLMPFDVAREPATVDCLNPLKLYQYLACGLPVVSSSWQALRRSGLPAVLCETAAEFVAALRQAAHAPGDAAERRRVAAASDWRRRVQTLLAALEEPGVPLAA